MISPDDLQITDFSISYEKEKRNGKMEFHISLSGA